MHCTEVQAAEAVDAATIARLSVIMPERLCHTFGDDRLRGLRHLTSIRVLSVRIFADESEIRERLHENKQKGIKTIGILSGNSGLTRFARPIGE